MDKNEKLTLSEVQEFSLQNQVWNGISFSAEAADRIRKMSGNKFLHLSVRNSGCTGYAYELRLIEQPQDSDVLFEYNEAKIYVDLNAMPLIDGTYIDYVKQGLNHTFIYQNPNVKSVCGCGESFGV